ncbi:MAG: amino acid ABC transporter substrate-binding protein [Deltaproteobacteria bacterium]
MNRRTLLRLGSAALLAVAMTFSGSVSAGETIKVGAVAPKSGGLAGGSTVTHWPNVQLWVKEVNDAGGLMVDGVRKQIELIEYDDKTNPGDHIKALQRLITQDEVDILLPPYGTGFHIAAAPIYAKHGYPMVSVTSITDQVGPLTEKFPNMFFTLGTTSAFVEGVVEILKDARTAGTIGKKIAMVNVADAFGIELAEVARPMMKEAGFEIVYDKSYPLGTADLSPIMKGAKASNPDAFIAWSYPPDTFGLTKEAITENLDVKIFYTAVASSFPAYGGAFGPAANNTLGAGGVNPDDPKIAAYRKKHEQVTGKAPDYWASANTYAAFEILAQAIEGVGTIDRAKITQYIKDNSFDTIMGNIKFENQVSYKFWSVGQWQDGVFRGVKGTGVDGSVGVRAKSGWQ